MLFKEELIASFAACIGRNPASSSITVNRRLAHLCRSCLVCISSPQRATTAARRCAACFRRTVYGWHLYSMCFNSCCAAPPLDPICRPVLLPGAQARSDTPTSFISDTRPTVSRSTYSSVSRSWTAVPLMLCCSAQAAKEQSQQFAEHAHRAEHRGAVLCTCQPQAGCAA